VLFRSGDPAAHRDRSRAPGRTLRQAVEQFHRERIEPTAKHERDAKRWIAEVDRWALAELGDKPLRTLTRGDVLHALEAATAKAPTVARRLRQRLHAVMERARVAGEIDTNPAAGVEAGLPARRHETEHHEAIPWQEAPAAAAALWADGSIAALAVLFAALTATRGAEVRGATWGEIEDGLWTIPAARMKTGREHVVPLSPAAMALLDRVKPAARGDALIFPGARPGRPTDPSTMLRTMRRIDARGSVHGWRSTFRDWCFDNGVERELAEACLAHQPATAVEAAYRRGTALDRRREAINSWGDHIFS